MNPHPQKFGSAFEAELLFEFFGGNLEVSSRSNFAYGNGSTGLVGLA
jgi:hypothetical protein